MEAMALILLEPLKYNPATNGTNRDTRLRAEELPTSSYIDSPIKAKVKDVRATANIQALVIHRKDLSDRSLKRGFIRFSLRTAEGARRAPLAVLIMAERRAPTKRDTAHIPPKNV